MPALNSLITNYPNGLASFGVPVTVGSTIFGNVWFVDTTASGEGDGASSRTPFQTMARAFNAVGDNDVIYFVGTVREQLVAPLGVTGVKVIGAMGGNTRDDGGAKWTYPTTGATAGKALVEILEQGWEFHNFLMTPETTSAACIKAHRNEDATYPDSSHFICRNMRFVGTGATTYGIEDVGGNHHYIIDNCEFQSLTIAIYCSSTSIAVPLRNQIVNNRFYANTDDIQSSQSYGRVEGNRFFTAGSGTHDIVNVVFNAAQGGNNVVTGNVFPNTEVEIAPATGYDGAATDTWTGNLVNNQAAYAFGDPA